jgi:hypothetical protein
VEDHEISAFRCLAIQRTVVTLHTCLVVAQGTAPGVTESSQDNNNVEDRFATFALMSTHISHEWLIRWTPLLS